MKHHELTPATIPLTHLCRQLERAVKSDCPPALAQAGQETCQLSYIASAKLSKLQEIQPQEEQVSPLDFLEGIDQFAQMKQIAQALFLRQQLTIGWLPKGISHEKASISLRLASLEDLKRHFDKVKEKHLCQSTLDRTLKPEEGPSLEEVIEDTYKELEKFERLEIDSWLSQSCLQTCIGRFLALLELFKREKILLYINEQEDELWILPQISAKAP